MVTWRETSDYLAPCSSSEYLYLLLADGVVTPGVVVGGVLLASDHVLRVKQMSVRPNFYLETKWNSSRWAWPDLVNDAGLQVHEESPGDVLACPSGWEESREGVVVLAWAVVVHHHPVRTDTVLQTVQLPGINIVTWCDIILTIFKLMF